VLRDLYVRSKFRDVVLRTTVLEQLDTVLERTRQDMLGMEAPLDRAGVANRDGALRWRARQAFYNTSQTQPFHRRMQISSYSPVTAANASARFISNASPSVEARF